MSTITRFAPSPTGPLHLGHAYSAWVAYDLARADNGTFHLRIDDLDTTRSRLVWEKKIYDDLTWLGLTWATPVMRQSERSDRYRAALTHLWDRGLLYPCTCTRRDIAQAASAPQEGAAHHGPDGVVYPGTCRHKHDRTGPMPNGVLRLDITAANLPDLSYTEHGSTKTVTSQDLQANAGDIVLARKDMPASYHLAVVLDDADQQITHVTRGQDLSDATQIHRALQYLLDLPTPHYAHHALVRDDTGKRLAKRDDARAIASYRDAGLTPRDVRELIGMDGTIHSSA